MHNEVKIRCNLNATNSELHCKRSTKVLATKAIVFHKHKDNRLTVTKPRPSAKKVSRHVLLLRISSRFFKRSIFIFIDWDLWHLRYFILEKGPLLGWESLHDGVTNATLDDSGNLYLRNESVTIWSTFENPTDTILPRQNFTTTKSLQSGPYSFVLLDSADGTRQCYLKVLSFLSGCQSPALPSKSFIKDGLSFGFRRILQQRQQHFSTTKFIGSARENGRGFERKCSGSSSPQLGEKSTSQQMHGLEWGRLFLKTPSNGGTIEQILYQSLKTKTQPILDSHLNNVMRRLAQ
ncbi:hypothetical protein IFM89_037066 [Coptis chinensis]|uniref:Bulb-type lectin domain-containing protein n=1 Tax=Coptis chinensis TaxID=261450 RepID=A0A835HSR2_9MAGN|nr:hypothetical protein IFM89_037066 [Coptis chinensis]